MSANPLPENPGEASRGTVVRAPIGDDLGMTYLVAPEATAAEGPAVTEPNVAANGRDDPSRQSSGEAVASRLPGSITASAGGAGGHGSEPEDGDLHHRSSDEAPGPADLGLPVVPTAPGALETVPSGGWAGRDTPLTGAQSPENGLRVVVDSSGAAAAASEPDRLADRAGSQTWIDRVVSATRLAAARGGAALRLEIESEGLGTLDLRVTVRQGEVHATLLAARDETRALLASQEGHLRAALERSDLSVGQLRVAGGVATGLGTASDGSSDANQRSAHQAAHALREIWPGMGRNGVGAAGRRIAAGTRPRDDDDSRGASPRRGDGGARLSVRA